MPATQLARNLTFAPTYLTCLQRQFWISIPTLTRSNEIRRRMETATILRTVAVLGLAVPNLARADGGASSTPSPPAYTALRYDEDYSYLKDTAARTDVFDAIKYIPLSERWDAYLTFG